MIKFCERTRLRRALLGAITGLHAATVSESKRRRLRALAVADLTPFSRWAKELTAKLRAWNAGPVAADWYSDQAARNAKTKSLCPMMFLGGTIHLSLARSRVSSAGSRNGSSEEECGSE